MAKLEISVRGLDKLTAAARGSSVGGNTADLQRTEQLLQRQTRLVGIMAKGAQEFGRDMLKGIQSVDARIGGLTAKFGRVGSGLGLGMQKAAEQADRRFAVLTSRVGLGFQRAAETAGRAMESAAVRAENRWLAAARRAAGAFGGIAGGAGRVIGSAGTQLGGVIGGLGTGGIGGLVRSAGSVGAIGVQGTANLGGAVAGRIPGVGGLLQGGAQAIGGLAGGAAQLAGNIGGEIVDKVLGVVKVGIAAGLGATVVAAIRGAKLEQTEEAFAGLTKAIGSDAATALAGFREAARGTISDMELMLQANRAVTLGAIENVDQFEQFITVSRRLGKAVGRDAGDALEDFTLGVARQSRMLLDNIGLTVRAEDAYEAMADKLGKSVDDLTEFERRTAFVAKTMESATQKIKSLGAESRTLGEILSGIKATGVNAFDQLAKAATPAFKALGEALVPVANSLRDFVESNREEIASGLSKAVDVITEKLKGLGEGLKGLKISEAFELATIAATDLWQRFTVEGKAAAAIVKGEILAFIETASGRVKGMLPFVDAEGSAAAARGRAQNIRTAAQFEAEGIRGVPDQESVFRGGNQRGTRGLSGFTLPSLPRPTESFTGVQVGRPRAAQQAKAIGFREIPAEAPIAPLMRLADAIAPLPPAILDLTVSSEAAAKALKTFDLAEAKRGALEATETFRNLKGVGAAIERTEDELSRVRSKIEGAERDRLEKIKDITQRTIELEEFRIGRMQRMADVVGEIGEDLQRQKDQLRAAFRSALPGARGDPSLPGNIRRGFRIGEGIDRRATRNQLRQEFGSFSGGEIGRSPELQARIEARVTSLGIARERPLELARDRAAAAEAPRGLAPIEKKIDTEGKARIDKALAEVEAAGKAEIKAREDELAAMTKLLETSRITSESLVKSSSKVVSTLDSLIEDQKKLKREFDRIEAVLKGK